MFAPPPPQRAVVDYSQSPRPGNRWLTIVVPHEHWTKRAIMLILAFAITCGVFFALSTFGHFVSPRIGQNGYQYGGKMLAETGNVGFKPVSGYQYIDFLWVTTPDGWYFPKYPAGVGAMNALMLKVGGWQHGVWWSYHLAPFYSAMATLAVFFFIRSIAGSFVALLGQSLLASNDLFLILGSNANSHPPALFFVTWGMVFLLWWWQRGWITLGLLAGFFIGYAFTTRYSEGLLAIPIGVAMLCSIRWRNWRSYLRVLPPMIGWMIPVIGLVIFNWFTMGHITGYDTTNESTGFKLEEIPNKWEYMLGQLHEVGMFFILPLGLFGLTVMFSRKWKPALLLLAWFLPQTVLYTAYYWGNNESGVAYLRFFLTLIPPMIITACYLLSLPLMSDTKFFGRIVAPVAIGIYICIAVSAHLDRSMGPLERDFAFNFNLRNGIWRTLEATGQPAKIAIDAKPILFTAGQYLPGQLQYAGDYEVYTIDAFNRTQQRGMRFATGGGNKDGPRVFQSDRGAATAKFYDGKSMDDMEADELALVRNALKAGRKVFASMKSGEMNAVRNDFPAKTGLRVKTLAKWSDPAVMTQRGRDAIANIGMGASFVVNPAILEWEVCEITLAPETPPTSAPLSAPATMPATSPTTQPK